MAENVGMVHLHPDIDIEGGNQPRYRKHDKVSRASSYGLGASMSSVGQLSRHSYHGEDEASISATLSKDLLNKLPSRQLAKQVKHVLHAGEGHKHRRRPGYSTLKLAGPNVAEEIADELLASPQFADEPDAMQIENIKEQYPGTTLATRKEIKQNIEQKQLGKEKKPSAAKSASYSISMSWLKLKRRVAEVMYSIELWKSHFKTIEGHFGTGVTSYFRFIKWLFLVNIPVFLLTLAFVITPQLMYRYMEIDNGYKDEEYYQDFEWHDILTGSGWLNNTELYYGSYTNETIQIVDNTDIKYNMQYAYLLTVFAYYIIVLAATMFSLSQSYKRNYIETSEEFNFYYVTKVFTGWDHSINHPTAAKLKHKSLFKELQEYLSDFRKEDEKKSCSTWCGLILLRVCSNLLIVGMLAGSGYLIWYLSVTQSLKNDLPVLNVMALPLTVTAINFILPFSFSILAQFERYHRPQTELYITMTRTIVLNVTTLAVLVYFWFTSVDCSQRDEDDDKWLDSELECRPCWETFMGEEIYRLVIVDFVFILLITLISEFCRRLMSQFCCKSLGHPEFNIGRNTLNLIYSQILVWLGAYYSPMLTFIHILKLFVIFYVKRISVTQNCAPSVKPWRGGRTHTFIMGLLFAALLLSIFSVGYSIVFLTPSEVCGPYKGLNATYDIIRNEFDDWADDNEGANNALAILVETLTSTFFIVALFLILCVVAHWSRVVAKGHEEMANILKHQISLEGQDKVFLMKLLGEAAKKQPGVDNITANGDTRRASGAFDNASSNNNAKIASVQVHSNPGYLDRSHSDIDPHVGPNLNPSGPGKHYKYA